MSQYIRHLPRTPMFNLSAPARFRALPHKRNLNSARGKIWRCVHLSKARLAPKCYPNGRRRKLWVLAWTALIAQRLPMGVSDKIVLVSRCGLIRTTRQLRRTWKCASSLTRYHLSACHWKLSRINRAPWSGEIYGTSTGYMISKCDLTARLDSRV